jgi:hypothetical protein
VVYGPGKHDDAPLALTGYLATLDRLRIAVQGEHVATVLVVRIDDFEGG